MQDNTKRYNRLQNQDFLVKSVNVYDVRPPEGGIASQSGVSWNTERLSKDECSRAFHLFIQITVFLFIEFIVDTLVNRFIQVAQF